MNNIHHCRVGNSAVRVNVLGALKRNEDGVEQQSVEDGLDVLEGQMYRASCPRWTMMAQRIIIWLYRHIVLSTRMDFLCSYLNWNRPMIHRSCFVEEVLGEAIQNVLRARS